MTRDKWKQVTEPLYNEEFDLLRRQADTGLNKDEKKRLAHVQKVLTRLLIRFMKHNNDPSIPPTHSAD